MLKLSKWLTLGLFASLLFVACGDDNSNRASDTELESSSSYDADYSADTYNNLPQCTSKMDGSTGFVVSSGKTYVCDDGEWIRKSDNSSNSVENNISSSSTKISSSSSSENAKDGAFFTIKANSTIISNVTGDTTISEMAYTYLNIHSSDLYDVLTNVSTYSNGKLLTNSSSLSAFVKDDSVCGEEFDVCSRVCSGEHPIVVAEDQKCSVVEYVGEDGSYKKYKLPGGQYYYYDKEGVLRITEINSLRTETYDKQKISEDFTYRCTKTYQNGLLLYDSCEEFAVLELTNNKVTIKTSYTYGGMKTSNVYECEFLKFGYKSSATLSSSSNTDSYSSSYVVNESSSSSETIEKISSSSVKAPSSYILNEDCEGTLTDGRDGKTYKITAIGFRTWMAENLNYDNNGDSTKSFCYDNKESNCDKYGRLYTWSEDIEDVCPQGWHIPSGDEWGSLFFTLDIDRGSNSLNGLPPMPGMYYGQYVEAEKLKSTEGWKTNGKDYFGFSVLPAGYYDIKNQCFLDMDRSTFLGISGKSGVLFSDSILFGRINDYMEDSRAVSIRCVRDTIPSSILPTCVRKGSDYDESTNTLTDHRDYQTYKTTTIGTQTWMGENLKYVFDKNTHKIDCLRGVLGGVDCNSLKLALSYTWSKAIQGACPDGWRLPSMEDWKILFEAVGGKYVAGVELKSTSGWDGTDSYGFTAYPTKFAYVNDQMLSSIAEATNFWSSDDYDSEYAYSMHLGRINDYASFEYSQKSANYPVRCLKE